MENQGDNVGDDKDQQVELWLEKGEGRTEKGDAVAKEGVSPGREERWAEDQPVGQLRSDEGWMGDLRADLHDEGVRVEDLVMRP